MNTISDIMFACCILYNMILEDERNVPRMKNIIDENISLDRSLSFETLMHDTIKIENEELHYSLRCDLIEHLWASNWSSASTASSAAVRGYFDFFIKLT